MYKKVFFFLLFVAACFKISLAQESLLNQKAPPIIFQHCLDKELPANFYKNKIIIIDFWATWCAPCIAGFPHFNQLSSKFGNKDAVFVALTYERPETVNKFFKRTHKQLNALKLTDTSRQTQTLFHVTTFPYAVIIDQQNIVRWLGNSKDLTADVIDKIINHEFPQAISKEIVGSDKPLNKPITQRSIFSFTIAKSDTTKLAVENGISSYNYHDNVIGLSRVNTPLSDILETVTGFGKSSRIITNDQHKLEQLVDIEFNLGKDTSLFKNYKDAILKGAPIKNFVISLLGNALKFTSTVSTVDTTHFEIITVDTAKLHSFKSMQSDHTSFDDDHFPAFEVVGENLMDIVKMLESSTKSIITTNISDKNRYDLSLNIKDMDTLNKSLLFHGLKLVKVTGKVDLLNINFY